MERRNIEREMVDAVMENPEQKVLEIDNIICYQSKVKFENKTYLLRIIVNEDHETPKRILEHLDFWRFWPKIY